MNPAIELEGLVKAYRNGGTEFRAVEGLSLTVARGEILGFLGPNGAGKTTTIKMILGLVTPDAGRITVDGLDAQRRRAAVLRRVGAVLEGNRNIYWDLTVLENLRYWGTLKGVPGRVLRARTEELIAAFDLGAKRHTLGKELSRGMQQKLAIACALLHAPAVLLLDEPTLGLDVAAARTVKEQVLRLARAEGCTIILTTHQLDVAQELCGRVAIMNRGRVQALDRTDNLVALFSRLEYEFQLAGRPPYRVTLREPEELYAVMDRLRAAGERVLAVHKLEADLETVFLHVTGQSVPGAGPGAAPGAGPGAEEGGREPWATPSAS